ncbi:UDP-3-O-acyl-N-acetylglucosamine deacetylase [Roseomonas sp. BN140053]|uniref:UDP-3-O-acyl-N-acetylglucosamine deacetylase n=1 Tax=Roseomonas sp. BN140053 TaxID=3391898 RepID=UPI0039ECB357
MDGFFPVVSGRRRTLKSAIGCVGIGLHSGNRVSLRLCPAPAGQGIVFRRTDLGVDLPARHDLVSDTRLCTALSLGEARVGTVEHVMAALAGCGVDDATVELDGPEVPILDGSAAPFVFLIDCAGVTPTPAPREAIEVLKTVRVGDGESWAELSPSPRAGLDATLSIEFEGTAVGHQAISLVITPDAFRTVLADARTFTLAEDVARLRAVGLARGGSLDNAVVVDGPLVLNPGGLRHPEEFVRHKLLDVVGDLALAGAPLKARFRGHRSGHALNNRLLRALFADASAWRVQDSGVSAGGPAHMPLAVAAAPAVA